MDWHRVGRQHKCEKCSRSDWCLYTDSGAIICMRVPSEKICKNGGWLHQADGTATYDTRNRTNEKPPFNAPAYWKWLQSRQTPAFDLEMAELGKQLGGVPVPFLRSEGVLWERERKAAAFGMMDANCNLIGVRLRWHDKSKGTIVGSRSGILYPTQVHKPKTVFIVEGQTDYLILRYLRHYAIGRQSCVGCEKMVVDLLDRLQPSRVIIIPDIDISIINDQLRMPGKSGAIKLSMQLHHKSVMKRPQSKDMRDWVLKNGFDKVGAEVQSWLE